MIVKDEDAVKRLNSPMNLINQMRMGIKPKKSSAADSMKLFGIGKRKEVPSASNGLSMPNMSSHSDGSVVTGDDSHPVKNTTSFNPFPRLLDSAPASNEETDSITLDTILENNEAQIKLGLAHDSALGLLNRSVAMLAEKLDDVKADKLPAVIAAASKTVESIRRERLESIKSGNDREVHYHFYTPKQRSIESYEVIDVG